MTWQQGGLCVSVMLRGTRRGFTPRGARRSPWLFCFLAGPLLWCGWHPSTHSKEVNGSNPQVAPIQGVPNPQSHRHKQWQQQQHTRSLGENCGTRKTENKPLNSWGLAISGGCKVMQSLSPDARLWERTHCFLFWRQSTINMSHCRGISEVRHYKHELLEGVHRD